MSVETAISDACSIGDSTSFSTDSTNPLPRSPLSQNQVVNQEPISVAQETIDAQEKAAALISLWEQAQELLKQKVEDHLYRAYFEPLAIQEGDIAERRFVIGAPSAFIRNHVDRNFRAVTTNTLEQLLGPGEFALSFSVIERSAEDSALLRRPIVVKKMSIVSPTANSRLQAQKPRDDGGYTASGLNSRYTFSNFVVGNNNQFCHAAAMRVAERPGASYNPLFIYGGVGLGKTHILHAIGNAVLEQNPAARVVYMSSETFTNELIQALRNAKMEEFKRRMRSIEVLLIDDIQFMCGKERTQEEFFHTFNTLYNAKHQIVLTSDKIPQDIPGIEERLQTRFSWGLTADLQAPDFETRVAILRRKASVDGFHLPEDVAQFVAEKVSSNVRELEGALTRVHAITSLQKIALTVEVASGALRPILQPKTSSVSVDEIKRVVANRFGIKVSDIISKRRTKNLSFPRHIAMYLCRKHTTCSYPEIGGHFGNRDHSSVIHAATVVSTKVNHDQSLRDIISSLERELFAG